MSVPTTQEEIEAYKRARVEAYEREQRENAEILRQKKEAEAAKLKPADPAAASSSGGAVMPSNKRLERKAKAQNRKTLDPQKLEELKKLRQQVAVGASPNVVVVSSPLLPAGYFPHNVTSSSQNYTSRLTDCCDEKSFCCYFPCVCCFLAKSKAMADGRPCEMTDVCCPQPPCLIRRQMKSKFGMVPSGLGDCCIFIFCCPCASCQDMIEMKRRYDEANIRWS